MLRRDSKLSLTIQGQEDSLEKEMTIHSSVLAWRIPGTEEPSGLPSMGSHRAAIYGVTLSRTRLKRLSSSSSEHLSYKIAITFRLRYNSKVKVKVSQSCPTIFDFKGYSPPGPSVHGIILARRLVAAATAAAAKSLQSCPALCDSVDCRPPESSNHGILQARTLEWVAMPSCRGSS